MTSQRVAVITMVQHKDFPGAWASLDSVESQLAPNVHRFVLVNDEISEDLAQQLGASAYTTVMEPGRNLGVAGGRNALIREAMRWRADWIVSLDDDLYLPSDYLSLLIANVSRLEAQGNRVGIVGPVVLDYREYADAARAQLSDWTASKSPMPNLTMQELRNAIAAIWSTEVPVAAIYHAGIQSWYGNYLRVNGGLGGEVRRLADDALDGPRMPSLPDYELRRSPEIRSAIIDGGHPAVAVDVIPGGVSAFSARLVDDIGQLDEAFSPFGFEDADFAIRSRLAGYANFVFTSLVALHDIEGRGGQRPFHQRLFIEGRSRALILRKHGVHTLDARSGLELALLTPIRAWDLAKRDGLGERRPADAYLVALVSYLTGWLDGATVGSEDAPPLVVQGYTERRWPIRIPAWRGSPVAGLPHMIAGDLNVSLSWDPRAGEFTLHRFELDLPGLGSLTCSLKIDNLWRDRSQSVTDYEQARLVYGTLRIQDRGALGRFDKTVARRRRSGLGVVARELTSFTSGTRGRDLREFLSATIGPGGSIRIDIDPDTPLSVGQYLSRSSHTGQNSNDSSSDIQIEICTGTR